MLQHLVSLIVTTTLLACPYTCRAGQGCCGEAHPVTQTTCCERCADQSDAAASGRPLRPDGQSDPRCCLCDGAILCTLTVEYRPLVEAMFVVHPSEMLTLAPESDACVVRPTDAGESFGDDLRIALGSLLR